MKVGVGRGSEGGEDNLQLGGRETSCDVVVVSGAMMEDEPRCVTVACADGLVLCDGIA